MLPWIYSFCFFIIIKYSGFWIKTWFLTASDNVKYLAFKKVTVTSHGNWTPAGSGCESDQILPW